MLAFPFAMPKEWCNDRYENDDHQQQKQRRLLSHAMAGTPTPSTIPTRQIRHAPIWTPAVKVPSASTVSAASALPSAFSIRLTSATNMRCIANRTAPKCSACVQIRRKRCSRFFGVSPACDDTDNSNERCQSDPIHRHGCLGEVVYATPKSAESASEGRPLPCEKCARVEAPSIRCGIVRLRVSHRSRSQIVEKSNISP